MRPDGLQVRQRSGERAARPAVDVQVSPADGPVDAVAVCRVHIQRLITRDRERTVITRPAGTAELLFTMFDVFCVYALISVSI